MKGLQKLIVASVAALGLSACDERKDIVVMEGTFTCSPAILIYEQQPTGSGDYRMECYSEKGGLLFKTKPYDRRSSIFCFKEGKCLTLYSKETLPE